MYAIYIITNTVNAKQYVGITKRLKIRWQQHKSANGSAPALHAAIKKYGIEKFVFTHFASAKDVEAAGDIERMLIKEHNTLSPHGYNLTIGGEGGKGVPMSEEQKLAISKTVNAYLSTLSAEEKKKKFTAKNVVSRQGSVQKSESKAKTSESTKAMWAERKEEILAKRKATRAINKAKKMKELA
jgi:group I intron endonuclease